jgi:phospholipid transport system transporter-binding protein
VAILLEWKRRALAEGMQLAFENVPPTMISLAELYGVDELLSRA